jgi:hypothetical protein
MTLQKYCPFVPLTSFQLRFYECSPANVYSYILTIIETPIAPVFRCDPLSKAENKTVHVTKYLANALHNL